MSGSPVEYRLDKVEVALLDLAGRLGLIEEKVRMLARYNDLLMHQYWGGKAGGK